VGIPRIYIYCDITVTCECHISNTSNMFEDSPVHIDRILAIKATVDDMRSRNEATHRLLQGVLDRLGPAQAQNVPDPI